MADRLVDLQHHLVGQQQRVHDTARTVRRGEKLQCFIGDTGSAADKPEAFEHGLAALLRKAAIAVQRAHLGIPVGMRSDAQARHDEAKALADLSTLASQSTMRESHPAARDSSARSSYHSRRDHGFAFVSGDA